MKSLGNFLFASTRSLRSPLSSREVRLTVVFVATVLTVFAISSRPAFVRTRVADAPAKSVTVNAAGKSNSLIHLQDGYELSARFGNDAQGSVAIERGLGDPLSLASADFDEDGVPDLVSGYANGKLALYRGNPDAILPNSRAAQQRKANGQFTDEAFLPGAQVIDLPTSPDIIQAGDFNADGHKDILVAARNSNSIYLLAGTGKSTFQRARQIAVNGQVTAMAAGEIGRADGQTDIAVAVVTEKGPQLLVFEHPEGAFKHQPEVFSLPAPATDIVLGDLDGDHYSDIAVATDNVLTIIHERGQAYPWDLIKEVNIQRPPAIVATRTMPFTIAALAIGNFGDGRGNSLALLAGDGSLFTLEPSRAKTSNIVLSRTENARHESPGFLPTGVEAKGLAVRSRPVLDAETAKANGLLMVDASQPRPDVNELMKKNADEAAAEMSKLSKQERAQLKAARKAEGDVMRERAKQAFLRTISAQPSTLPKWNLQSVITDSRLSAVNSATGSKLVTARISLSGHDDLILIDSIGRQIQIVSIAAKGQEQGVRSEAANYGPMTAKITSLPVDAGPTATLPMQLNGDALSDLVVLRNGASQPSVVLTTANATLTVNDSGDGVSNCVIGPTCTLRNAIQLAKDNPGTTIAFNIPGAGVHTISPTAELPVITGNGTVIDGSTQPGFVGFPLIEIKGNLIAGAADGLKVRASNCQVFFLAINEFPFTNDGQSTHGGNGITLESLAGTPVNGHNFIEGNFLGTDPTGMIAKGRAVGLLAFTSDNNLINGNLLSGNGGFGLDVTGGNNNVIVSNYIGLAVDGITALGNANGVFLTGANNQFGGDGGGQGNTVSGNSVPIPGSIPPCRGGIGILIPVLFDVDTGDLLTQLNLLKGNKIGTSADGNHPLGNCSVGIDTDPLAETVIGSIAHDGRNIISDNGLGAIYCVDQFGDPSIEGGFCAIIGNNIGTDILGTTAMGNDLRDLQGGLGEVPSIVEIGNDNTLSNFGAPGGTTPGGDCTGFCNLLSGNGETSFSTSALGMFGYGTLGAFNNYIGTNRSGNQALPNFFAIDASPFHGDVFVGGLGSQFGVPGIPLGNLISGNSFGIFGEGTGTLTIEGNLIGTDAQGINAVPNGCTSCSAGGGISIANSGLTSVQIGDTDPLARNIISGNTLDGISFLQNPGTAVTIVNNNIGVNSAGAPLANTGAGISFFSSGGATIGGSSAAEENLIQNNGRAGILLLARTPGPFGQTPFPSGVDVQRNKIKNNGGLGIDLSATSTDDGVTDNDCQDADAGPNELQNFPVLDAPVFNANGTVSITGSVFSEPIRDYRIDLYSNSAADPTGYGEGENFIGSVNVTTEGHGFVTFDFTSAGPVTPGSVITATETNERGSTSEFSKAADASAGKPSKNGPLSCGQKNIVVNVTSDEDEDPMSAGVSCSIDHTATAGEEKCTLRAAIHENETRTIAGNGPWTIQFNIPATDPNCDGTTHVCTIAPLTVLPPIIKTVTIDGTSQPGYLVRFGRAEGPNCQPFGFGFPLEGRHDN